MESEKEKKNKLIDTENRFVVARGGGTVRRTEMGKGGQKVKKKILQSLLRLHNKTLSKIQWEQNKRKYLLFTYIILSIITGISENLIKNNLVKMSI